MTARLCLIAACAAGLSACAAGTAATPPSALTAPLREDVVPPPPAGGFADAEQEAIYAVSLGRAGLTARVASNGCTRREDFAVQVLDGYPAPTVILRRLRHDQCRAFAAGGADLLFTWADLRLPATSPLVLANPLTADPTPGR